VLAVAEATSAAVSRARAGDGPTFLECMTYRWCGHSRSDQCVYRTREEEAEWKVRCPIGNLGRKLLADATATEAELEKIAQDVADELAEAEDFARSAPQADTATLEADVFEIM